MSEENQTLDIIYASENKYTSLITDVAIETFYSFKDMIEYDDTFSMRNQTGSFLSISSVVILATNQWRIPGLSEEENLSLLEIMVCLDFVNEAIVEAYADRFKINDKLILAINNISDSLRVYLSDINLSYIVPVGYSSTYKEFYIWAAT